MGGAENEMILRSKKRRYLMFFITLGLTDYYKEIYLLSDGPHNPVLQELKFTRPKRYVYAS